MKRALLIALAALLITGCGDIPDITGVWHSKDGVAVSWPQGGEFRGRVELVVGQYGEAIAGMIRLYREGKDFKENYLYLQCPCSYLERASFDGHVLIFDVIHCITADGAGDSIGGYEWSGVFSLIDRDGDDELSGWLEARTTNVAGVIPSSDVFALKKSGDGKVLQMEELNLGCEDLE